MRHSANPCHKACPPGCFFPLMANDNVWKEYSEEKTTYVCKITGRSVRPPQRGKKPAKRNQPPFQTSKSQYVRHKADFDCRVAHHRGFIGSPTGGTMRNSVYKEERQEKKRRTRKRARGRKQPTIVETNRKYYTTVTCIRICMCMLVKKTTTTTREEEEEDRPRKEWAKNRARERGEGKRRAFQS